MKVLMLMMFLANLAVGVWANDDGEGKMRHYIPAGIGPSQKHATFKGDAYEYFPYEESYLTRKHMFDNQRSPENFKVGGLTEIYMDSVYEHPRGIVVDELE